MRSLRPLVLSVALAVSLRADGPGLAPADARRLSDAITGPGGRAFDYVQMLTEGVGPRLTGSSAYEKAARVTAAHLRDAGVADVRTETVALSRAWERVSASARIESPEREPLHVAALGWTASTPAGGVTGDVVAMDDATPDVDAESVRGRIVLVTGFAAKAATGEARDELRRTFDRALHDAGALAILVPSGARGNTLVARVREFGSSVGPMPAAELGRDDVQTIRRLMARGPVRVTVDLQNRVSAGPVDAANVVGEIRGVERPDEWVLVGAHLDSWDFATGAQDNATGVAMVVEAARAIVASGLRPRRSIRFALWAGEEEGLLGSTAYARAHASELADCVAVLNTDGGTGPNRGWTATGRRDLAERVRVLLRPLLSSFGPAGTAVDTSVEYAFDSDHTSFLLAGIPALDLNPDDAPYEEVHHTALDSLSKVNRRNLSIGSAIVAVSALAIADDPSRIAPRLTEDAIRALLTHPRR